jgi:hypothetical protein
METIGYSLFGSAVALLIFYGCYRVSILAHQVAEVLF